MIELGCRGRALMAAALHGQQQAGEGDGRTMGVAGGPADHDRGDRDLRARGGAGDRAGVLVTRPDWWTPEHEAAALEGVADGIAARRQSALDDRRQRAREAAMDGIDASGSTELLAHIINEAIETATRVQITPEIITATGVTSDIIAGAIIKAAFEAAGLEVEAECTCVPVPPYDVPGQVTHDITDCSVHDPESSPAAGDAHDHDDRRQCQAFGCPWSVCAHAAGGDHDCADPTEEASCYYGQDRY